MRISRFLLDAVLAHARAGYPHEVCGVLVGRPGDPATVDEVVPVDNREFDSPRTRYEIDPSDLLRVQRQARQAGREILGYYHSHPDHPARPSETDRRLAAEGISDGVVHVVVGVAEDKDTTPTAWVFHDSDQAFAREPLEVR